MKSDVPVSAFAAAADAPGFWRAVSAVIRDGLAFVDDSGVTLEVNGALCAMTGFERAELLGQSWPPAYWPTESSAPPLLAQRVEHLFRRKTGEQFWVSVDVAALPEHLGRLITVRDISEHKRVEEALRASEQRWRSVAENPYDYVVILDRSYNFQYINHVPDGWVIGDLIGKHGPLEVADPSCQEAMRRAWEITFRDGTPSSYEAYVPSMDVWFFTVVGAIFEKDEVVALSLLSRDITAAKRAEQMAAQLEARSSQRRRLETLGTMAGGIAHDFNNLLVPILNSAELLLQHATIASEPGVRELVDGISAASLRARDVVRGILLFARGSGETPTIFDVGQTARDVAAVLRTMAKPNVGVELRIQPGSLHISGVAGEIHQALVNLITNAHQSIGERPGLVTVAVERAQLEPAFATLHAIAPGPAILVRVEDNGPGMPEAVLERVFEPFYTTKPVGEGTGLGLSVVHSVMTKHRGVVTVESRPGSGACFCLYFPAAVQSSASARQDVGRGPAARRSRRILIAEDDPAVLRTMRRMLEQAGHVVSTAKSGGEALERVARERTAFDLVVSDENMPKLRGSELAARLLAVRDDLPVILLSGDTARLRKGPNVCACLEKPVQMETLLDAIDRVAAEPCVAMRSGAL